MKTRRDPSTKPYYRCFLCPKFRTECGGRPTRDMDIKNWCEYIGDTMDFFHLSNACVTEKAESSLKTTERIRACSIDQDILRGTARRYELAVFGTAARHVCAMDFEFGTADKIADLQAKIERLEKDNARYVKIIDDYLDRKEMR
ncbi:MAG: hypothetical protein IKW20_05375 [Bacteroidales bacterium]|nr:hypothetical protein [Bacteroidales bacterium]